MFTGSVSENRITVGLPPPVRQELFDYAKDMGTKVPEVVRRVMTEWYESRVAMRELRR